MKETKFWRKKNKLRIKIILYILINNLDIHFSFFKILFSNFGRVLVHIYIISFYSNWDIHCKKYLYVFLLKWLRIYENATVSLKFPVYKMS